MYNKVIRITACILTFAFMLTVFAVFSTDFSAEAVQLPDEPGSLIMDSGGEWLPVGDVLPSDSILISDIDSAALPSITAAKKSNPMLRSYTASTVPGGTRYGYDWLANSANTGANSTALAGIYEALMRYAETAYAATYDYTPYQSSAYCNIGALDLSALNLPVTVTGGSFNPSGAASVASLAMLNLAYMSFLCDNPQFYMFSNNFGYAVAGNATIGAIVPMIDIDYISYQTRQTIQSRVNSKFQEYATLTSTVQQDYDKIRLVHDKMLAERDYSYIQSGASYVPDTNPYAHNILGVMDTTTKGPVCESFAEAFSYILHRLGVGDAITVVGMAGSGGGDGSGGHAWNIVKVDGQYYYADPTWNNRDNQDPNSPYYDNGNKTNDLYYKYFLVGRNNIDFGAGNNSNAIHWAAGTSAVPGNTFVLYGLPVVSSSDYIPSSPYTYLTDNGFYGRQYSATPADDWAYTIGKGTEIYYTIPYKTDGNPLFVYNSQAFYWNTGPFHSGDFPMGTEPLLPLYKWTYYANQSAINTMFQPGGYTQLTQGVDYTVSPESAAVGSTTRVWVTGTGNYRGIDFSLMNVTHSDNMYIIDAIPPIESAVYQTTQAVAGSETAARTYVNSVVASLSPATTNTINSVLYTPPSAGTISDFYGTDGSYTFTVTVSKGAGTPKTTRELTLYITASPYDSTADDNQDISDAKAAIEALIYLTTQEATPNEFAAKAYVENLIAQLSLSTTNVVNRVQNFVAPTAGTALAPYGTDGSYTFIVTINKGSGAQQTTIPITLTITAAMYDPTTDNTAIGDALSAIEAATYQASQADAHDEAAAKAYVEALIAQLPLPTTNVVITSSYTAPEAGTSSNISGTNGSYDFTVAIGKGSGTPVSTRVLTLVITATPYNPAADNLSIISADNTIKTTPYQTTQAATPDETAAKAHVENIIASLYLSTTNVVNRVDYTPPSEGTALNVSGTDGSYVFTVTISKGAGTPITTTPLTLVITATPYAATAENADIAAAKTAIENAVYQTTQAATPDETAAKAYVESVIAALSLPTTNVVSSVSYSRPYAGVSTNPAGTNGRYTFTVTISKGVGTPQTTRELALTVVATPHDPSADNADIALAKYAIENAVYQTTQAATPDITAAKAYVESVIASLPLSTTNTVSGGPYTPPIAGTAADIPGTDGSYIFTVTITKGAGTPQTTMQLKLVITATPYDTSAEDAAIAAAKTAIENAVYQTTQTAAPYENDAKAYIESVIAGLSLSTTNVVTKVSYTAPDAGTVANISGSDGSYIFTVDISKGVGTQQTTIQLTLVITATPYDLAADNNAISSAKTAIENAVYQTTQAATPDVTAAKAYVESVIAALSLSTTNSVTEVSYTPPTTGSAANPSGANGSYVFTVDVNKGAGTQQTTSQLTLVITATQYDPADDNAITSAKTAIENAVYQTTQAAAPSETAAKAYVESIIAGLSLSTSNSINKMSYTPPTTGSAANPSGSNGSYVFTVDVNKGAGTQQTTSQLTLVITATPYDPADDNAISSAKTAIENAVYQTTQAATPNVTAAKAYVESVIAALSLSTTNSVTEVSYTPPTTGSAANPSGANGSYVFTVEVNKGAGTQQTTSQLTLVITATQYDPADDNAITSAKTAIENAVYQTTQAAAPSEPSAKAYVESVIAGLSLSTSNSINKVSYTTPVAGTAANTSGTNGSYVFAVTITKGAGTPQTTTQLTLVITAAPYTPPSGGGGYVPVYPSTPSVTPSKPTESSTSGSSSTTTAPAAGNSVRVICVTNGEIVKIELPSSKVEEITKKTEGDYADINLSKATNIEGAELPTAAVASIANTPMGLSIALPQGAVTLGAQAASNLAKTAMGGELLIRVKELVPSDDLNSRQREVVGNRPIYDISIVSGGAYISAFGGELISISIPYELKPGETPSGVKVFYLGDSGDTREVPAVYDKNQKIVVFSTSHLSKYYIEYKNWVNTYGDVSEYDWYYDAVRYVSEQGIMQGTDKGFEPQQPLTRAMMVTILYNYVRPDESKNTVSFSDVPEGKWYSAPVAWAASEGIVLGVGNNKFDPNREITRQELCVLLHNFAKWQGKTYPATGSVPYADMRDIADWAYEAALWLSMENVVVLRNGNMLEPKETATRAESAAMLTQLIKNALTL